MSQKMSVIVKKCQSHQYTCVECLRVTFRLSKRSIDAWRCSKMNVPLHHHSSCFSIYWRINPMNSLRTAGGMESCVSRPVDVSTAQEGFYRIHILCACGVNSCNKSENDKSVPRACSDRSTLELDSQRWPCNNTVLPLLRWLRSSVHPVSLSLLESNSWILFGFDVSFARFMSYC